MDQLALPAPSPSHQPLPHHPPFPSPSLWNPVLDISFLDSRQAKVPIPGDLLGVTRVVLHKRYVTSAAFVENPLLTSHWIDVSKPPHKEIEIPQTYNDIHNIPSSFPPNLAHTRIEINHAGLGRLITLTLFYKINGEGTLRAQGNQLHDWHVKEFGSLVDVIRLVGATRKHCSKVTELHDLPPSMTMTDSIITTPVRRSVRIAKSTSTSTSVKLPSTGTQISTPLALTGHTLPSSPIIETGLAVSGESQQIIPPPSSPPSSPVTNIISLPSSPIIETGLTVSGESQQIIPPPSSPPSSPVTNIINLSSTQATHSPLHITSTSPVFVMVNPPPASYQSPITQPASLSDLIPSNHVTIPQSPVPGTSTTPAAITSPITAIVSPESKETETKVISPEIESSVSSPERSITETSNASANVTEDGGGSEGVSDEQLKFVLAHVTSLLSETKIQMNNGLKPRLLEMEQKIEELNNKVIQLEKENRTLRAQVSEVKKTHRVLKENISKPTVNHATQTPRTPATTPLSPQTAQNVSPSFPTSPGPKDSENEKKGNESQRLKNSDSLYSNRNNSRQSPRQIISAHKIPHGVQSLIIGDSVMRDIDHNRVFHSNSSKRISIPGLALSDLLAWLNSHEVRPGVLEVIIHVGVNSCWRDAVSVNQWEALIKAARRVLPNAHITLSSIMPPPDRSTKLAHHVKCANDNLFIACNIWRIWFVDHSTTFLTARGYPRRDLYWGDQLHPNKKGSAVITGNLATAPSELGQMQPNSNVNNSHSQSNKDGRRTNKSFSDAVSSYKMEGNNIILSQPKNIPSLLSLKLTYNPEWEPELKKKYDGPFFFWTST